MIVFDVFRNGERLCRAGIGDSGVLSAMTKWVSARRYSDGTERQEQLQLDVGGLRRGDHQRWVSQNLAVGDEIRIHIVEADDADEAADRKTASEAGRTDVGKSGTDDT